MSLSQILQNYEQSQNSKIDLENTYKQQKRDTEVNLAKENIKKVAQLPVDLANYYIGKKAYQFIRKKYNDIKNTDKEGEQEEEPFDESDFKDFQNDPIDYLSKLGKNLLDDKSKEYEDLFKSKVDEFMNPNKDLEELRPEEIQLQQLKPSEMPDKPEIQETDIDKAIDAQAKERASEIQTDAFETDPEAVAPDIDFDIPV